MRKKPKRRITLKSSTLITHLVFVSSFLLGVAVSVAVGVAIAIAVGIAIAVIV
jgi:hypothetical protein